MNKQIDKQTNKQTTKLDDIHDIHIKMLYILWGRYSAKTQRCFNMSTIGHVGIRLNIFQGYNSGQSTGYCINIGRLSEIVNREERKKGR